ncbi:MAG: hypothetical protein Q7T11_07860 [Deltaproteobacteria bacterium]|nr:hypothetical protein [Deltaproteobacteria bacterium]
MITRSTPIFALILALCVMPGCFSSSDSDTGGSTTTSQYLIIPNASWYSGSPSYSVAGESTAPSATVTEGSEVLTVGNSVTWEVSIETIIEVEAEVSIVVVTSDDFDGYFEYPITEDDILNGFVDIEMDLEESLPSEATCNRDYLGNGTCYEQVDSGVTSTDFAVANDSGGDTLTLTASVEVELTIDVVEETSDSGDDGSTTSGDATCSAWTELCSCSIRACSDGTNAWYDVGSAGVYYCASTSNCTAAANSAVAYCTSGC